MSDWDTPLRVNPNRSEGRFNRRNSPPTQYIALHPLTAWAEYLRYHELDTEESMSYLRLRAWVIRVILEELTEIRFDDASGHGLEPDDLVSDDWTPCQDFGDRLRGDASSPQAIRVASAALPGTDNVAIFGERVPIPYLWTPVDEVDLPATVLAEAGRPPAALLAFVRQRGDEHVGLDAWKAGRTLEFADLTLGFQEV